MSATLANHLLQSTVFAVIAGLLTLLLRNNHARTRYWIWLTASLKFLIPFSIFVELGHRLTWSSAPAISQQQLAFVVDAISQPFTVSPAPVLTAAPTLPILPAIWICGSLAVLIFWLIRSNRVAAQLRASDPRLEPGAFGIFRPVLYLPAGIADHLDEAQLNAIVAHELCHIRRRDNLTAALHMLVEAVFWFHPLVWWIGGRLIDERERACDEEVIRLGSDPEVYAESILKVCRLYVASPLDCASGISGSDLAARIESIMKASPLRKLSAAKKLTLGAIGIAMLAAPIAAGVFDSSANLLSLPIAVTRAGSLVPPPPPPPPPPPARRPVMIAQAQPAPAPQPAPQFEVASVKPHDFPRGVFGIRRNNGNSPIRISGGRVTLSIITLETLVREAYGVRDFQVTGAPGWKGNNGGDQFYDIEATVPGDATPTVQQVRQMLQTLLAERFQLKLHRETKGEMPVYDLVIAKNGSKLKASTPDSRPPANPFTQSGPSWGIAFTNKSIPDLIVFLNPNVDRPVIDKTGLNGSYDFTLEFEHNNPDVPAASPDANRSIYAAVQEQLGLQLVPAKQPIEIIVIDHAERPSEN